MTQLLLQIQLQRMPNFVCAHMVCFMPDSTNRIIIMFFLVHVVVANVLGDFLNDLKPFGLAFKKMIQGMNLRLI